MNNHYKYNLKTKKEQIEHVEKMLRNTILAFEKTEILDVSLLKKMKIEYLDFLIYLRTINTF